MKAMICDRCGTVIKGKDTEHTTKVSLSTERAGTYQSYHLCEACAEAFELFLQECGDKTSHKG